MVMPRFQKNKPTTRQRKQARELAIGEILDFAVDRKPPESFLPLDETADRAIQRSEEMATIAGKQNAGNPAEFYADAADHRYAQITENRRNLSMQTEDEYGHGRINPVDLPTPTVAERPVKIRPYTHGPIPGEGESEVPPIEENTWKLTIDEREIGREGIAQARAEKAAHETEEAVFRRVAGL